MQLRDLKFIMTVLSGVLRDPCEDEDGERLLDEDGHQEYDEGLAAAVCADGKVHTHLLQTKETGRAASARPPMQVMANRRESDYARILGTWQTGRDGNRTYRGDYQHIFPEPLYNHPVRSIFVADPGYVLAEADYVVAELAAIAWASGDANMIDHVRRNELPESHPDHYDIHSRQAVDAFHLTCPPTKSGLKAAGYASLRVASKNVNFGVPYGRGALAIARQCREEGVDISEADAQMLIDAYFAKYPGVKVFLEGCQVRTQPPHQWLMNFWGRRRRFIESKDKRVIGDQQRQGQNCTIQGDVADAINCAIYNFGEYRQVHPELGYRLLLQIHDALLFLVPIPELRDFVYDERDAAGNIVRSSILRECMCDRVPVWPRRLDGTPIPVAQPYHFGVDTKVALHWGEKITTQQCAECGIDPLLA